jgi:hypothetical protein
VGSVVTARLASSNMLGQSDKGERCSLVAEVGTLIAVASNIYYLRVLHVFLDFAARPFKAFDVYYEDLWKKADLGAQLSSGLLIALLAFIFVLRIELCRLKKFGQTFNHGGLTSDRQASKRLESYGLLVAASALDHCFVDSTEGLVNDTGVGFEVLVVYLLDGPAVVWLYLAVESLDIRWGLFVLQFSDQVHQELVTVMLHGRCEMSSDLVLESCGVHDDLVSRLVCLESIMVKVGDLVAVVSGVGDGFYVFELGELRVDVVVS